jgi:cytochrome c biogenesis protein CcmG, thiol:disulfide interchange protein DsbE
MGLLLAFLLACGCDRGSEPNLVGKRAPDFTVKDSDRTVSLHDLHGKVIVLNFWATWCPPCVQEMPALVTMQSQLKDRVNVLAVSVDQDPDTYHRFLRQYNVNLLTVRDPVTDSNPEEPNASTLYGTTKLYKTDGYPETFIIDTQGVIRRKFIGPVEWTKPEIMEYLKQL